MIWVAQENSRKVPQNCRHRQVQRDLGVVAKSLFRGSCLPKFGAIPVFYGSA